MSGSPLRGVVTLAVVGALAAAVLISPVSAGGGRASKGWVRKLVNKRIAALSSSVSTSLAQQRTRAFSQSLVGPFFLEGAATDVIVMSLPVSAAGNYVVMGKLWWTPIATSSTGVGGEVDCDMLAGEDFDTSREAGNSDFDYGTVALNLVHRFDAPGAVVLRCRDEFSGGNPIQVHNVRLTAFEVNELTSKALGRLVEAESSERP